MRVPTALPPSPSPSTLTLDNRALSAFQTDKRSMPHQRVVQPLG